MMWSPTRLAVLVSAICLCHSQLGVPRPENLDLTLDEMLVRSYTSGQAADFIQDNKTLLVELDVTLTPDQWAQRHRRRGKRSGLIGDEWPDATVPYEIDEHDFVTGRDLDVLDDAFAAFHRYTCCKFRPSTYDDDAYIYIYDKGRCSSGLGYTGVDYSVSLAKNCRTHGIVVHELMHALGVHHEQTRPDRDQYVTLNEANIDKSMLYNFEKHDTSEVDSRGIPYDYLSIMHYGSTAFTKDNSKPSIITRDSRFKHRIGQRYGMSFEDIKLLTMKYKCNAHCPKRRCPNGGFLSKDCQCWCKKSVEFGEPVALCESGERVPGGDDYGRGFGTCGNKRKERDCKYWKDKGYCDSMSSFMMKNCRDSCGWCATDQVVSESEHAGEVGLGESRGNGGRDRQQEKVMCENNHESCLRWADIGYCEEYLNFMSDNCKRSCGVCSDGVLTAQACQFEVLDLGCSGGKVVKIHNAMYGRKDRGICTKRGSNANINCVARDSLSTTKKFCEGKTYCTITASNDVFTPAGCGSTSKYLEVQYSCQARASTPAVVSEEPCENDHPSCEEWSGMGFCENGGHQTYMTRACRKACALCGDGSKASSCRDISPHCALLVSQNARACGTNPHWMGIYCRKTCKACRASFRRGPCKDANASCAAWIDRGMCMDNEPYMRKNCAKSCNFCG